MGRTSAKPRPIALSPSRANDYQQCPLLFRFRAIDRLPEPATLAQITGTLTHAVLEEMMGWPAAQRDYPGAVKQIVPQWQKMLAKNPEYRELVPEADEHEFLVSVRSLVKGYFQMENPQGLGSSECEKFVDTVVRVPITTPSTPVTLVPARGFIDRVDVAPNGAVRLVDYKTGKKPQPRYADQARFQMLFYALVWRQLTGTIPAQLRLMYVKVADEMTLSPSEAELNHFARDVAHLWTKIVRDGTSGSFRPKTSKLCDWCSFQEYCPEKGGTPPEYPGWPGSTADALQ